MCVISVINSLDAVPSHDSIDKMAHENPHGNSISYFDQVTKSIIYHKAVKLKKLKKKHPRTPVTKLMKRAHTATRKVMKKK